MQLTDKDILSFKQGNMTSFKTIYEYYVGKVYNYFYSLTNNENLSKDLTQNTFLQLWNSKSQIDIEKGINGYLFAISKSVFCREIRAKAISLKYQNVIKNDIDLIYEMPVVENMTHEAIENKIMMLINELPESRRQIFMLRWRDGLTNKEVAERLHISDKTVSTQMNRTLSFLRLKLGSFAIASLIISGNF